MNKPTITALDHARPDPLSPFAEEVARMLGLPITIESDKLDLLAYSSHAGVQEPARVQTILRRQTPTFINEALHEHGVLAEVAQTPRPVIVPAMPALHFARRAVIAIGDRGQPSGFIWALLSDMRLDDRQLAGLAQAAQAAAQMLSKPLVSMNQHERASALLGELLKTDATETVAAEGIVTRFGVQLPVPYRLVRVTPRALTTNGATGRGDGEWLANESLLTAMVSTARQLGRGCVPRVHDSELILCLGSEHVGAPHRPASDHTVLTAVIDRAADFGLELDLVASRTFTDMSHIPQAHRETRHLAIVKDVLGKPKSVVTPELFGALGHMSDSFSTSSVYDRLHEIDCSGQFGFPVVATVEAFLDHGGMANEAARSLHVHVNTLNYRLQRIAKETGADLADGLQRLLLHADIKLVKLRASSPPR